ncbi:hypothetical protein KJ925_00730 [Patescibacteria group bacterium]|nr:hypothetical protein [Patescibacteria group bacterium]
MQRSTFIYGLVLTLLLGALGTVGVLILRKRGLLPQAQVGSSVSRTVTAPAGTIPLSETPHVGPWKPGDPVPEPDPTEEHVVEGDESLNP